MRIKRIFFLLFLLSLIFDVTSSFGQGGTWTWISGDSAALSLGVFGTKGVPSVNNHPPALFGDADWKDKEGNFWLYGGVDDYDTVYDNLWQYNPFTDEWTWVKGSGPPAPFYLPPVYGTKGVADTFNTPGSRGYISASWVDTSGNLWLFGGNRGGSIGKLYNDLWKYDISTNNWTWMSGDTVNGNAKGIHGVQGIPDSLNVPGAREACSAWTDSLNNLWLFGGWGLDDNGNGGYLNDLCKYNIASNEWTWMKGSALVNDNGNYGIKGIANASNDPCARGSYTKWKDLNGNFWLMGGVVFASGDANDVWKYDEGLNEWTWTDGTDVFNDNGSYNDTCVFDTLNMPSSRYEHTSAATDNCGRFWLFGGITVGNNLLNDLWVFDPQSAGGGKWKWVSGTFEGPTIGNHGTLGVPAASNIPSSRDDALAWWGNDNRFYLFGGECWRGVIGDLWSFNPDTTCISFASCPAKVILPVAVFQSNDSIFCANDCINFTNNSTNAASWQWSFAGATDSTSTAQNPQNICYSKAGIYNVTLIASNSSGSDTLSLNNYITVLPAPPAPSINQAGNTLHCSTYPSYRSYQWYYDSTLIAGATDTFLIITKSGNYNVEIAGANGCKTGAGINVVLGVENYSNDNIISIYPNPATNELLIDGSWKLEDGSLKLTIINVLGQTIYTEGLNRKASTVNCKPFPSGIYFLEMQNETGRWVGRFVKE